jgi:hypothetical protein
MRFASPRAFRMRFEKRAIRPQSGFRRTRKLCFSSSAVPQHERLCAHDVIDVNDGD